MYKEQNQRLTAENKALQVRAQRWRTLVEWVAVCVLPPPPLVAHCCLARLTDLRTQEEIRALQKIVSDKDRKIPSYETALDKLQRKYTGTSMDCCFQRSQPSGHNLGGWVVALSPVLARAGA